MSQQQQQTKLKPITPMPLTAKSMSQAYNGAMKKGKLGIGFGGEPKGKMPKKPAVPSKPKKLPTMNAVQKSVKKTMGY